MCSAYTALPDSASAAQYRPTWRRGPRPWGPSPARYAPLVVVVYCRVCGAQSQVFWMNALIEAWCLPLTKEVPRSCIPKLQQRSLINHSGADACVRVSICS